MTGDREAIYTRARTEIALLAALAILVVAAVIAMVFAEDTVVSGRRMVIGVITLMALLPVFSFKLWFADNLPVGIAVATVACAVGGYLASFSIPVALVTTALGALAGWTFYRIRLNTNYRPRLRGE
ncbi:MAG: hypothetical protein IAE87_04140 [Rhodobacteraceae bacterium]|jgi:hypothetical protein|nr:hypothetical protein [Paracoccaceae bacterium]